MNLNRFGRTKVRPYGCTLFRASAPRASEATAPSARPKAERLPERRAVLFTIAMLGLVAVPGTAAPPSGEAIYTKRCAMCHDKSGETRAPARSVLENLTVERILDAMTTGTMKAQAWGLSATERKLLASFLSSKHVSAAARPAATMGQCQAGHKFSIPKD